MSEFVKIRFALKEDAPVEVEALWAIPGDSGGYVLDNIPMYVDGVSAEDEVGGEWVDGELWATSIIKKGMCSTVRVEWIDFSHGEETARRAIMGLAERLTSFGIEYAISPDEPVASLCLSRDSNAEEMDALLGNLAISGKVKVFNSDRD